MLNPLYFQNKNHIITVTRLSRRLRRLRICEKCSGVRFCRDPHQWIRSVSLRVFHDAFQSTRTHFRVRNSMAVLDQRSDDWIVHWCCSIFVEYEYATWFTITVMSLRWLTLTHGHLRLAGRTVWKTTITEKYEQLTVKNVQIPACFDRKCRLYFNDSLCEMF